MELLMLLARKQIRKKKNNLWEKSELCVLEGMVNLK